MFCSLILYKFENDTPIIYRYALEKLQQKWQIFHVAQYYIINSYKHQNFRKEKNCETFFVF